jgi:hypothetical protein
LLAPRLQSVAVPLPGASDGALVPDDSLVALATRDADTRALAILLVDRRIDDGPARDVRLSLPPGRWALTASTLTGDSLAAKTVQVTDADLGSADGSAHLSVPAHAIVVVDAHASN